MKIEVEVRDGRITNVKLPKNCMVSTFNYDVDRFTKMELEIDNKGKMCKITNWLSEAPHIHKFRIEVKAAKVHKVSLPKGSEIVVRSYKDFGSITGDVKSYTL